jgi:hypothetical protein
MALLEDEDRNGLQIVNNTANTYMVPSPKTGSMKA